MRNEYLIIRSERRTQLTRHTDPFERRDAPLTAQRWEQLCLEFQDRLDRFFSGPVPPEWEVGRWEVSGPTESGVFEIKVLVGSAEGLVEEVQKLTSLPTYAKLNLKVSTESEAQTSKRPPVRPPRERLSTAMNRRNRTGTQSFPDDDWGVLNLRYVEDAMDAAIQELVSVGDITERLTMDEAWDLAVFVSHDVASDILPILLAKDPSVLLNAPANMLDTSSAETLYDVVGMFLAHYIAENLQYLIFETADAIRELETDKEQEIRHHEQVLGSRTSRLSR